MAPRAGETRAQPSQASKPSAGKSSRGGARAGGHRRGGFPGQKQRIGGQEVSWDYDPELEVDDKPRETYPELDIYTIAPPTIREKAQVELWRQHRRRLHEGPLYTVAGGDVRVNKSVTKKGAIQNPFEDMPSYTQKYKQPAKTLPDFSTRRYCLKLFPEELWDVIEPKRERLKQKAKQPKRPFTDGVDKVDDKAQHVENDDPEAVDANEALDPNDEDAPSEANPEDDFAENDSDMGGDYNAEQYFDAGEDDEMDGDDGGEEGGFD